MDVYQTETDATIPEPETTVALCNAVLRKCRESINTQEAFFATHAMAIVHCSEAMVQRFAAGGRLFLMGNAGSFCDAMHMMVQCMHPIMETRSPLPAMLLGNNLALHTAVGNGGDFTEGFAEELRVLAQPGDMALGLSTSGNATNVVLGLRRARELGLLTIGFAGGSGGRMASLCEHMFVVDSFSAHRVQETHVALLHILWDMIHVVRGAQDSL